MPLSGMDIQSGRIEIKLLKVHVSFWQMGHWPSIVTRNRLKVAPQPVHWTCGAGGGTAPAPSAAPAAPGAPADRAAPGAPAARSWMNAPTPAVMAVVSKPAHAFVLAVLI